MGLFNLMEERDIQIRGHRVRLPLDIYVVASANPEDYTNRGRIITPLKDRYGALIRTHYPKTVEEEVSIVDQERSRFADTEEAVVVPDYMAEIVGEFTALARRSADINQRSGVSVRVSIANYETLAACALRRAIRYNESQAVPRVSDLPYIIASTLGKLELETVEDGREARVVDELTKKAVLNVFNRHFDAADFVELVLRFEEGLEVEAGSEVPSFAYAERLGSELGLKPMVEQFGIDPVKQEALFASGAEFVLDGLHLNRKLNRDRHEGKFRYRT